MSYCTHCGHQVDAGRFCTQCGASLAEQWRTDTAERELTAVLEPVLIQPAIEPIVQDAPPSTVRPLYADEAVPVVTTQTAVVPVVVPAEATQVTRVTQVGQPDEVDRSRGHLVVLAGAAAVVLLFVVAWMVGHALSGEPGSPDGSGTPTVSGDVVDLTRGASASAPETARPNLDLTGDLVRYEASNLLDGVPSTAWRMDGDGSGETLTITLPGPSVVTRVGLVNGYAKVDHDSRDRVTNWYDRNRRILEVEWIFDDGTTVVQHLDETRRMQSLEVGPVSTSTIQLKIMIVTRPGDRDYTAISDVLVEGASA